MAGSVRCFMKLNLGLLSKNVSRHIALNQSRTLFSESSLGLSGYLSMRDHYKNQFTNLEESFRNKMKNYVDDGSTSMIFTDDLKAMLHLAEKTPDDMELIVKMLKKFNSQDSELRFGTYHFGPVVMRSFHRLNEPDVALNLFNDPTFSNFFNQLSSYQILLDLLYKNGRYKEMRDVYDTIKGKLTDGRVHPRNALILVTAACYKENTAESLRYALELWSDLSKRGYPTVRRVLTHIAALAMIQGQPHMALEVLVTSSKPRYIAIRCLKIMAYAELDRVDDILPFFRSSLEVDDPVQRKDTYFKDTIEKVEAAIERNNMSPDSELVKLLNIIRSGNLIQVETVDDHINKEVYIHPPMYANHRIVRSPPSSTGKRRDHYNTTGSTFTRRPGLRDLI